MARVLIADDSPFMRRVIKEILEENGYSVVQECANGLEASQQYEVHKPDLVLMDYNMPRMNGIEGARKILKGDPKAAVVMVTSIGGKKRILEALRIGVKNYVTKPFENEAFLKTVRKVLGQKAPEPVRHNTQEEEVEEDFQVIGSFFGQYLLQKGILTEEQLLSILEIQSAVNRKIGQIAVDEGLMLPEKIETVLKVQKRINKYFGQLAIQMGLLTRDQLTYLLERQQERYIHMDEILRREQILPEEVISKELETFKVLDEDDQGVFNMKWVSRFLDNGYIFEAFIEQTLKLVMRLAGIFVMEGESTFDRKEFNAHGVLIRLAVSGDQHWSYHLNLSETLALQIAEAMLEDDLEEGDEVGVAAASEFANIACGNAIGKLDSQGVKLEISPPKIQTTTEPFSFSEKEQVLCVPILVPEGEMELIISGVDVFQSKEGEKTVPVPG